MRKWLTCLAAAAALLLGSQAAYAQNARIVGTVKDQTGGALPGASVTARNQETGLTRTATSDGVGNYRLPALPPGTYKLIAELTSFSSESRPDLVLVIDQTATIDFALKPASVAETVTVTGESPLVDTTASAVSTSVSNQQIQDLPVASRRWIDLAMLTPGTSQDGIRGFFYRGNVNVGAGGREYSNAFVVDGVNNTWAEMGEARQNFAMDSIREFKVSTSNYKAEYGLATGGLVTVVSKSGSNDLHGSGFLFFRDKSLTSIEEFQTSRPPYRRYQYGGSLGGPILKDKTHFFLVYEGTKENQFFTVNTRGIWPQYDGTYKSAQTRWTYMARVDHQLTQGQSLFFRWAAEDEYRPIITAGGRIHPTNSFDFAVPRKSAVLGHTWILGPRTLNEFRAQYAFAKYEVAPPNSHGDWEPGDFGQDRLNFCTPIFIYPSVQIGGCGNSQMGPESRWQVKNDFSYLLPGGGGQHQLKAGADFSYVPFRFDSMGSPLGSWTFSKDAPYNAADPTTYPTQYNNSLPQYGDIPTRHFSAYVQDDWEPARGLTFNLGLRYDLQMGSFNEDLGDLLGRIQAKLGRDGSYPLPIPWHQGAGSRGDHDNFGPRIGFAWDPKRDGVTNIHAAYGRFYDNIRTLLNGLGELTWPQAKPIVIIRPAFPDPLQGRSRDQFISSAPPNITVLDNAFENPFAHQVNVGVSRSLTRDIAVSADGSFVWRYADRNEVDVNLPDRVTRQKPYPQFGRVTFVQSTQDNSYKALLLKLEKRMSHHYQFLVSYTLSKAMDNAFTSTAPDSYGFTKVERPASVDRPTDRRHRLVVSGIAQLPWEVQLSAIGDFRTSLPFAPTTALDLNGDAYTGDLPSGVAVGSGCRGLSLDAVNAFRTSRGLAAVSTVACPTFANVDVRLSKAFLVNVGAHPHRLELIAQLFNVLNRANENVPTVSLQSALFGQTTSLLPNINAPSRQAEIAIRYQF
jgi:hypothetical protein